MLADRPRAALADPAGRPIEIDDRGAVSGPPASLTVSGGDPLAVEGWAGPWPLEERWWDRDGALRLHRLQATAVDGSAWLLAHDDSGWWVEAVYD